MTHNAQKIVGERIGIIMDFMEVQIGSEFIGQGHNNRGSLIRGFETRVIIFPGIIAGELLMDEYGLILNDGVKPNRIPYQRGSGRGNSKYITALKAYVRSKGLPEGVAYAIANKQKQEGMPTRASFRFSRTGKRTGAIDIAVKRHAPEIERDVSEAGEISIEVGLDEIIKRNEIV